MKNVLVHKNLKFIGMYIHLHETSNDMKFKIKYWSQNSAKISDL